MKFQPPRTTEVAAVSGVATAYVAPLQRSRYQVSVTGITGSDTVTLTAQPIGKTGFEAVTDGTISLASPTTLIIDGAIDSFKLTSTASPLSEFTLVVTAL